MSSSRKFREIPRYKLGIISLLSSLRKKDDSILKLHMDMHRKNGGMTRMMGKNVFVSDPKLIEEMFRQEDKYPVALRPPVIRELAKERGYYSGLSSYGEEWYRTRRVLNTKMLRPKLVDDFAPKMNEVVTDFMEVIAKLRDDDGVIPDLRNELFGWSLEMMGTVALGTRLGAIGEEKTEGCREFCTAAIENIRLMFHPKITIYPVPFMKVYRIKAIKQLSHNLDTMLSFTLKRVEEALREIEKNPDG